jgi:hypothetical protein
MTKRRLLCIGALGVVLLGAFLAFPLPRLILVGWLRGESFYQGRPTGYFIWDLQKVDIHPISCPNGVNDDTERIVQFSFGCHTTFWEDFLERYFDVMSQPTFASTALFHGDPAAAPVLMELLASDNPDFRMIAALGLREIGPPAKAAVPMLLQMTKYPDYASHSCARMALWKIDPQAFFEADLERPGGVIMDELDRKWWANKNKDQVAESP